MHVTMLLYVMKRLVFLVSQLSARCYPVRSFLPGTRPPYLCPCMDYTKSPHLILFTEVVGMKLLQASEWTADFTPVHVTVDSLLKSWILKIKTRKKASKKVRKLRASSTSFF
jgi:hypothetical protein